jgi:hypothetical protein
MDRSHEPLVATARSAIDGRAGAVLDLGCGNGALLAKIVAGRADLEPYGIDREARAIVHARELQATFADNFVQADLFDTAGWAGERRYALALLMIGRLLEVPTPAAQQVLAVLRSRCDAVVVYAYPGYGDHPLPDMARDLALRIDERAPGVAAISGYSGS